MTRHILVVEDEPAISDMLKIALVQRGYRVSLADRISSAKQTLADDPIDLALIDWMLPGGSGLELVRFLRHHELTSHLPIIMLTARTEEQDITAGLDAGADDYVTKPFSPRELGSRIKALLRRSHAFEQDVLTRGRLVCNTAAKRISVDDEPLDLSHTEYKLLLFLMRHQERVFSRAQLLDQVWGQGTFIEERTIDVHILRLRKILKSYALDGIIQTVRGAGYRFSVAT